MKFLFVLSVASLLCNFLSASDLLQNGNQTVTQIFFDDMNIRNLQHEIELLNSANEIIRVRLEALNARLERQTDLLLDIHKSLLPNGKKEGGSEENERFVLPILPLIDVRHGFVDDPKEKESSNSTCDKKCIYATSCSEAAGRYRKSGLYTLLIDWYDRKPFLVSCDEELHGGGWTVIQRRIDGSVDFYRNWTEYKIGFGDLKGEFFVGLDLLHALTTVEPQELLIVMEDFDNARKYAKYDAFAIGNEKEAYALKVLGTYSGDAGDSLVAHKGHRFTTKDMDNDENPGNCAQQFTGAWWYKSCHLSNLNGQYLRGAYAQEQFAKGVVWHAFRGYNYALKFVQMMIRPRPA